MSMEKKLDPITTSVLSNRFMGIIQEMSRTLIRTSRSPIFVEARDIVSAVFDKDVRLIAQIDFLPVLSAAAPLAAKAIAAAWEGDIHEGDVFLHNDAYSGASHPPDFDVAMPVFYKGKLVFWSFTKGHMADTGGSGVSGYNTNATTIWDDGMVIPPVKLYDKGVYNRSIWDFIEKNTKASFLLIPDIHCLVGGATVGKRALTELLDRYGVETVYAAIERIVEATEKEMRDKISLIPDGTYYGERAFDNDVITPEKRNVPVWIRVKITKEKDHLTVDFSDSDPQTGGYANSTYANTVASTYLAFFNLLPGSVARNEGALRPIEIIAPEGLVVNPKFPAAVSLSTVCQSEVITECIWHALAEAVPDWVCADTAPGSAELSMGWNPRLNRPFVFIDFLGHSAAAGGTEGYDGWDFGGPICTCGQHADPDCEIYELTTPIRFTREEREIDTAGAGKFRGGSARRLSYMALTPITNAMCIGWGNRDYTAPLGALGGKNGRKEQYNIHRKDGSTDFLDNNANFQLQPGDIFEKIASGGGGFGDPLERDIERVQKDVRNEVISIEKARDDYGVVIEPATMQVDEEKTKELRKNLKQKTG